MQGTVVSKLCRDTEDGQGTRDAPVNVPVPVGTGRPVCVNVADAPAVPGDGAPAMPDADDTEDCTTTAEDEEDTMTGGVGIADVGIDAEPGIDTTEDEDGEEADEAHARRSERGRPMRT